MRASLRITLIIAGFATLIALLASGALGLGATMENVEFPEVAYVNEEISVSYTVTLDGWTWDDVNSTGATYTTGFIGEFYNHSIDQRAAAAPAKGDVTYTVKLTMPDTPGTYRVWGWVHVKGYVTDYTIDLGDLEVKVTPQVQFGGTLGWNLVGRDHEVWAYVKNADPSEIQEVSVYWDTVSHREEVADKALYPNRTDVISYQLLSPYYFNITLPDVQTNVYIMVHGLINGRDFYDSTERAIGCYWEPEFNVTAPVAAFEGRNVVIAWSIPTTAGAHTENTSVFWDTVSHAGAMDGDNYAYRSDVLPGNDSRSYEVMLTMPSEEGTVYFVVQSVVKMYLTEFYTTVEHTIEIIGEPAVTVTQFPDEAFVDADVQFVWTVSAPAGAVEETAIHWDTTSHAGSLDIASYPEVSVWMIGEEDRTYDVTFEMPGSAGTLYFIAHALVLGEDFYVTEELSITVRGLPTVSITTYTEEAYEGETATIEWEVTGALETDNFITMAHWSPVSHIDDPVPSNYPDNSYGINWKASGEYSYELELPMWAGTLYLIVSADVQGVTYVDPNEVAITIKALPSVANVTEPEGQQGGKTATLTFKLDNVDDPEKVEVLWDTSSHEGDTDYPNTVVATDSGNGTWTVEFEVPNEDTDIFYVVHVQDGGNDVYSEEGNFAVTKKKKDDTDSPGFTMLLMVVALSLIALYVATDRRS